MTKAIRKNATKKIAGIFEEVNTLKYYTLDNCFIAEEVEATTDLKEKLMQDIFKGHAKLRANEEETVFTIRFHSNLWIEFTTVEEEAAEEVVEEIVEEEAAEETIENAFVAKMKEEVEAAERKAGQISIKAAPVEAAPVQKDIYFNLGYIGHKAEKLQALFEGYSSTPNEHGKFLAFENTTYIGNKGVTVMTNCFESEEHFNEMLQTKLLFAL
jgi:hypothetical protein